MDTLIEKSGKLVISGLLIVSLVLIAWLYTSANRLSELSSEVEQAHSEITSGNATQQALSIHIIDLETDLTQKDTIIDGWRRQAQEANNQVEELQSQLEAEECTQASSFRPNYSSNSTMSTALKDWLENNHETIYTNTWDVLYNNTQLAIHKLSGEFGYSFVVWFNEPDFFYTQAVFWINGECWLDH